MKILEEIQKVLLSKFAFVFLLIALSCSSEKMQHEVTDNTITSFVTKSHQLLKDSENYPKRLDESSLSILLEGSFKDVKYSVKSIPDDSNPLLYVVNFQDNGWAIVAGYILEENQIVAYSDKGHFDPDNVKNPEVSFWYEMILSSMKTYRDRESEILGNDILSAISGPISYDEDYYWVKLPLGTVSTGEDITVNHLLRTKWGQDYPWNYKSPYGCPVGCVAVAASQILYYLHYYLGFPNGLHHSITPVFSYNPMGYWSVFDLQRGDYHPNSNRWDLMALTKPATRELSSDYVGDLMLDVATYAGMTYTPSLSASGMSSQIFHPYGIDCDSFGYNFSTVRNNLDNGLPVMIGATGTSLSIGHAWVIDGYQFVDKIYDTQYQWRMIPPDSLSYYHNINYDYVLTEVEMQRNYPSVQEFDIEHNYYFNVSKYLLMNWGWNGNRDDNDYQNGHYSIVPVWSPEENQTYNSNITLLANFNIL